MPTVPENFFAKLRLSNNQNFRLSTPETASRLAQIFQQAVKNPDVIKAFEPLGVPASTLAGLVDTPLSAASIRSQRERKRNLPNRGLLTRAGEGFASTLDSFGLLNAAARVVTGPGSTIPSNPFPDIETSNIPLLGEVDPVKLGAQVLASFIPAIAAVATGGATLGAAAPAFVASSPGLAGAASFALGGGLLEGATQVARAVDKGEDFKPLNVIKEAAIFGAGGIPFKGGQVLRRIKAGATAAGAATAGTAITGDVDPGRIATEIAFATAFGNTPFLKPGSKLPTNVPKVTTTPSAPISKLVPTLIDIPTSLLKKPSKKRANINKVPLRKPAQPGKSVSSTIIDELDEAATLAAASARSPAELDAILRDRTPPTSKPATTLKDITGTLESIGNSPRSPAELEMIFKLRKSAAEELAKTADTATLQQLSNASGGTETERQIIRDALSIHERRSVVDVDAPADAPVLEPQEFHAVLDPEVDSILSAKALEEVDDRLFSAPRQTPSTTADPQFVADNVANKALKTVISPTSLEPIGTKGANKFLKALDSSPEERLRFSLNVEEAINRTSIARTQQGLPKLNEDALRVEAMKLLDVQLDENQLSFTYNEVLQKLPEDKASLRQLMLDVFDTDAENATLRAKVAKNENPSVVKAHEEEAAKNTQAADALQNGADLPPVTSSPMIMQMADTLVGKLPGKNIDEILKALDDLDDITPEIRSKIEIELKRKEKFQSKVDAQEAKEARDFEDLIADDDNPISVSTTGGRFNTTSTVVKTGKSLSLGELRASMDDGGTITPLVDGTFDVVMNGQSTNLKTLAAVADEIEAPSTIKTTKKGGKKKKSSVARAKAAGNRKLIALDHTGNGEYRTINKKTGEVINHTNIDDAIELITKAETTIAPELMPLVGVSTGGGIVIGGGGSIGAFGETGGFALDLPTGQVQPFPTTIFLNTKNELFKKISDAVGIPVWDEIFNPMTSSMQVRDKFQNKHRVALREVLKGIKPSRMRVVNDLLIAGEKLPTIAKDFEASAKEVAAAKSLRMWYKNLLEIDEGQLQELFTEVIPAHRKTGGNPDRTVRSDNTVSGSIGEILPDIANGRINLAEPSALVLSQDIMFAVANRRFMQPSIARANKMIKTIETENSPRKAKGRSNKRSKELTTTLEVASQFMDSAIHGIGGVDRGATTAQYLEVFLNTMKRMKLADPNTTPWTPREVDAFANEMSGYLSGAALSFRVATGIRNFSQRLLAGNKVGFGPVFRAQRMSHTPEGIKLVNESNVIPERITFLLEDVAQILLDDVGNIRKVIQGTNKLASKGLWLFKKGDHGNRANNFLAGYLSFKEQAPLLREGNIDQFLINTGIANETLTVQNRLFSELRNSSASTWDAAVEKSAKEFGKRLAEDVQFLYNPTNAPQWMQSIPGRFAGQFGLWSTSWVEYMSRNLRGLKGSPVQQAAARKFARRAIAQMAAISTVGYVTGVDVSSYNKANPIGFEGGPAFGALKDAFTLSLGTQTEFGQRLANRNLNRFFATFSVPFGGLAQDIGQSFEQEGPAATILTGLGFNVDTPFDPKNLPLVGPLVEE